jgi:hypothetical protein
MPDNAENPAFGFMKTQKTEIGLNAEEMKAVLDTEGKQFWTDPEIAQIASKTNELNLAIQKEIAESRALLGSPEENAESALAKLGVELGQAIDAAETVEPIAAAIQKAISGLQANERVFANKYNTQAYLADLGISVDTKLI